jgi:mono/diheme cytochrome c family protein
MDSIVPPDENGVPYPENLMPQNYGEVLTEDQLNDLVAYVLSLGNS